VKKSARPKGRVAALEGVTTSPTSIEEAQRYFFKIVSPLDIEKI
jgi:hypothetical protein